MDVIDVKVTRSPLWAADGVVTTMGRASDQSVISHPPLANGGRWLAGDVMTDVTLHKHP